MHTLPCGSCRTSARSESSGFAVETTFASKHAAPSLFTILQPLFKMHSIFIVGMAACFSSPLLSLCTTGQHCYLLWMHLRERIGRCLCCCKCVMSSLRQTRVCLLQWRHSWRALFSGWLTGKGANDCSILQSQQTGRKKAVPSRQTATCWCMSWSGKCSQATIESFPFWMMHCFHAVPKIPLPCGWQGRWRAFNSRGITTVSTRKCLASRIVLIFWILIKVMGTLFLLWRLCLAFLNAKWLYYSLWMFLSYGTAEYFYKQLVLFVLQIITARETVRAIVCHLFCWDLNLLALALTVGCILRVVAYLLPILPRSNLL